MERTRRRPIEQENRLSQPAALQSVTAALLVLLIGLASAATARSAAAQGGSIVPMEDPPPSSSGSTSVGGGITPLHDAWNLPNEQGFGIGKEGIGFVATLGVGGGYMHWAEGGIRNYGGGIGLMLRGDIWPAYSRYAGFGAYFDAYVGALPVPLILVWGATYGAAGEFGLQAHFGARDVQLFGKFGLGARNGGTVITTIFDTDSSTDLSDRHSYSRIVAGIYVWPTLRERFSFYGLFDQPRIASVIEDISYGLGFAYRMARDYDLRVEISWQYANTSESRGTIFVLAVTKMFGTGNEYGSGGGGGGVR